MNGGKSHATEDAGAPDDMLKVLAITDRKYDKELSSFQSAKEHW